MTDQNDDFASEFDDEPTDVVRAEETAVEEVDDGAVVTMKFPKGVDPKIIQQTMNQVGLMTAERMKGISLMDKARADYQKNGHRRWVCEVESLQEGVEDFRLTYPHPKTDKPITVQGECGVRIPQGLTKYVIDRLNESFYTTSVKIKGVDPESSMALTYKTVRKPCYKVTVYEEVKNPGEPGKIDSAKPVSV